MRDLPIAPEPVAEVAPVAHVRSTARSAAGRPGSSRRTPAETANVAAFSDVGEVRARDGDDDACRAAGRPAVVAHSASCRSALASASSSSSTRFGSPARTAGRKNPLPMPATTASADDLQRGCATNGERAEHDEPAEIRGDHQALAGEPVDERAEQQPDRDRREDVGDQHGADPPAGVVRADVEVRRERDQREPVADPRAERSRRRGGGSCRAAGRPRGRESRSAVPAAAVTGARGRSRALRRRSRALRACRR